MHSSVQEELREKLTRIAILAGGHVGIAYKDLEMDQMLLIDGHEVFPSASVIKVPIMVGIMSLANRGILRVSDLLVVEPDSPEAVKQRTQDGSGVLASLSIRHELTVEELCTLMIIVSDNVAANLLLDIAGMDAINQTLAEFGLTTTKVTDRLEDFDILESPLKNPTTPYEMLCILEMIYQGLVPFGHQIVEALKRQQFKSRLPLLLPDDVEVAHKTGSLQSTFHDSGIVYSPSGDYVLCVMATDISSKAMGQLLIAEVSRVVYEAFRNSRRAS